MTCLRSRILVIATVLACALWASSAAAAQCTDTEWLTRGYNDLLFRQPSQQEIAGWIDPNTLLLAGGATRFIAGFAIATGDEGETDVLGGNPGVVAGWFQLVLGRDPAPAELSALKQLFPFPQGIADYQVIAYLIGGTDAYRNEFKAHATALNPAAAACDPQRPIVDQIFQIYLNRNPTRDELDTFTGLLAKGTSLSDVAIAVATGTLDVTVGQGTFEYFNLVVATSFVRFLHRAPGPQELILWSKVLAQNGINEELDAVLMATDEYCDGIVRVVTPSFPVLPTPQTLQGFQVNIASPPPQYNVQRPQPPNVVAADGAALNLLNQVLAQNQTILQLGGGGPPSSPPDAGVVIIPFDVASPGSVSAAGASCPAVLVDVTAQLGSRQASIDSQQATIQAQGQLLAAQLTTITSLVDEDFGLGVNASVAAAARVVAQQQMVVASAVATGPGAVRALDHARSKQAMGDDAQNQGDFALALHDYTNAFKDATRAIALGSK
jgi:hypothetical protein